MDPSRGRAKATRCTRHRGSGIEKKERKAEEGLGASPDADAIIPALSLSSTGVMAKGHSNPAEASIDSLVAHTDWHSSSPSEASPPNSPNKQLRTALADAAAAAATATQLQEAQVHAFLASLDVATTSTDSAEATDMQRDGNKAGAAQTHAGEAQDFGVGKAKRKRAADFFDDNTEDEDERDQKRAKHA